MKMATSCIEDGKTILIPAEIMEDILYSAKLNIEHYMGDLVFSIMSIVKKVNEQKISGCEFFGIRQNGCDHLDYIKARTESARMETYKDVFKVSWIKEDSIVKWTLEKIEEKLTDDLCQSFED